MLRHLAITRVDVSIAHIVKIASSNSMLEIKILKKFFSKFLLKNAKVNNFNK